MQTTPLCAQALADIVAHAQRRAPHECVGAIMADSWEKPRLHALPLTNLARDPTRRFEIAAHELLTYVLHPGWYLYALYHSHPVHEPRLSQADILLMDRFQVAMVIAGLRPVEVRTYRRDEQVYKCLDTWRPSVEAEEAVAR